MNWLNVFIPNLRSSEFSNSEPAARATWLSVLAYCCEQENGGVRFDAEGWSDRAWLQNCGCTAAEARNAAPLIAFEMGAAIVWNYPEEKEKEVQAKRKAGKRGGLAKAAGKASAGCATSCAKDELQAVPLAVLLGKGKELEGNEKEMKEKENVKEPSALRSATQAAAGCTQTVRNHQEASGTTKKRQSLPTDDEWLRGLQTVLAYEHLNVAAEFSRAQQWCFPRNRKCTRRFFTDWLNRSSADRPMTATAPKSAPNYEIPGDAFLRSQGIPI